MDEGDSFCVTCGNDSEGLELSSTDISELNSKELLAIFSNSHVSMSNFLNAIEYLSRIEHLHCHALAQQNWSFKQLLKNPLSAKQIEEEDNKRLKRSLLPGNSYWKQLETIYMQEWEAYRPEVSYLKERLDSNRYLLLIPEKYQYLFAIEKMIEYLINKRACNWKECVNLYEEELYKDETIKLMTKQTEHLNAIRHWTRSTALSTFFILTKS